MGGKRWARAKADTRGFRHWKREIAVVVLVGPGSYVGLRLFGSNDGAGAVDQLIVAAIAVLLTLIVLPTAELAWNYARAPVRLLTDEVHELSQRVIQVESARDILLPRPPQQPSDLRPMSELEAAARRNREDVVRADLVYLGDELAKARRTLSRAYNNKRFWRTPIETSAWLAVKDKHLAARGFHNARSHVAEAYEAIRQAEDLRMWHEADPKEGSMHDTDSDALRRILDRVVEGENALTGYLDGLDMP